MLGCYPHDQSQIHLAYWFIYLNFKLSVNNEIKRNWFSSYTDLLVSLYGLTTQVN